MRVSEGSLRWVSETGADSVAATRGTSPLRKSLRRRSQPGAAKPRMANIRKIATLVLSLKRASKSL